jgi:hypothetical protein
LREPLKTAYLPLHDQPGPPGAGFDQTRPLPPRRRLRMSRPTVLCFAVSLLLVLFLGSARSVSAAEPEAAPAGGEFAAADLKFFEDEVQPILEHNCFKCHAGTEPKGSLSLAGREFILKGGDSGPAVDLQDPEASLLVEAINYASYEMPPTGKMSPADIATLTKWVKLGLPMPAEVKVADAGHKVPQVNAETKSHWAFQPVERPPVPEVDGKEWVANPIDAFVLAKLEEAGLQPNPEADPRSLYRRLHYDLLGLPPTLSQIEQFAAAYEDDPKATWKRTVDELLESPHYGEHWARYWLDLVRYAETNSFERDNPKPFVWKYRDYVIRSLNEDKPYDQFLREQLAGDELDEVTAETLIATGFYRLGLWDDEPADPLLAFYDGLDDLAATTGQAFLGLTMNCARCHDHKLDPIPQSDYYSFIAFFRNMRHYGVRSDESVYDASVRSVATPEEERAFAAEKEAWSAELATLRATLDRVENEIRPQLEGGEKDDFEHESQRPRVLRRHAGELIGREEFEAYEAAHDRWTELKRNPPRSAALALVVKENGAEAPPTHVLLRGNPQSEGDLVEPAFPGVLSPPDPNIVAPKGGESTGRRRALAEWIASPHNPLTARVMANRIWQWHFGRGIVRSSNNFGLQGDAPTHPELLDWLAAEFVDRGWSLKEMHRLILTSNSYRMSSSANSEALAQDPQNDLLWRFDMRRLRAEEVRDSILAVIGALNLDKMYGPSIYPKMPEAVLAGQSKPGAGWETSSPEEARRRSVYIHIKRSLQLPLLAAFDVPESDFSCPERFVSTQPTQALGMLNSEFMNRQAQTFAADVRREAGGDAQNRVAMALRRTMQREPTPTEVERGVKLMQTLREQHGLSEDAALNYFCLLALNLNEFLYLD